MEQPVPMRPPQELVGFAETYKRGAIEKLVEHRAIDAEFKRTLGLLEQDGFEHRRCDASPWNNDHALSNLTVMSSGSNATGASK